MSALKKGDKAPAFTGTDQQGKQVDLDAYRGRKVILYFYPKDDTPGCTAEACNLRDNFSELASRGFDILGVSPDPEASHRKFISKYELPFTLISDPNKKILRLYDAWGTRKMYGKIYQGVLRKTYVIDEVGVIMAVIDQVKTKDHTRQILEEINK